MTPAELAARLDPALWQAQQLALLERVTQLVAASVRANTPVGKGPGAGALRASITGTVEPSAMRGVVSTSVAYALAVNDGSSPHVINARPGGVLAFQVGGNTVFARSVNHPGYAGAHFIEKGLDSAMGSVESALATSGEALWAAVVR